MAEARQFRERESSTVAFRPAYAAAFEAFLRDESETALRSAYELGRDAVSRQVGLLELAQTHHAVIIASLAGVSESLESQRITRASADFLVEALSAYEMVRRAVAEAQEAVLVERRQAEMIRQLSTLLADTSLALQTHSSIDEMLQLVVEQTLELIDGTWCAAHTVSPLPRPTAIFACAGVDLPDSSQLVEESYAAFEPRSQIKPMRVAVPTSSGEAVAVALAALDGQTIGLLAIGSKTRSPLSDLDEAVLTHIGQMTAAALERALRYHSAVP
jgi:GAF domain-containing protein